MDAFREMRKAILEMIYEKSSAFELEMQRQKKVQ